MLKEFASKRQVKLSRVTVRAKDEDENVKPASKHRRRRARAAAAAGGGGKERKESERSLAKVCTPGPSMVLRLQSPTADDHVPRTTAFDKPPRPRPARVVTPRIHSGSHQSRSCGRRRRSWSRRQAQARRRRAPAPISTGTPTRRPTTSTPTWRRSCRTWRCSAAEPPGNGGPRCRASPKAKGERSVPVPVLVAVGEQPSSVQSQLRFARLTAYCKIRSVSAAPRPVWIPPAPDV